MSTKENIPRKEKETAKLNEVRRNIASRLTPAIARFLAKTSISPDIITVAGFLIAVGAAVLILTGHQFAAGFVVIAAGFCDMLDGALARSMNRSTAFGAVLDSTLDRLSESVLFLSILVVFGLSRNVPGIWITGITLTFSLTVSYIRSRAEALGLECEVGLFTRPERVIVLAIGLLLSGINNALVITLGVIAFFSLVTIYQRIVHVWEQTRT